MTDPQIIPEFSVFAEHLADEELQEIQERLVSHSKSGKNRFRAFTDVLLECISNGEWKDKSHAYVAMCSRAAYLRGQYGINKLLSKHVDCNVCKAFAAASYCKQSFDSRHLNTLNNHINQIWHDKDYIYFAELTGYYGLILSELGFAKRAYEVLEQHIEQVTEATKNDDAIRSQVQEALLFPRIVVAYVAQSLESRTESMYRLEAAEKTARMLDNELALVNIDLFKARALSNASEYDGAHSILVDVLGRSERMGYMQGVTWALNLLGVINLKLGNFQEARDQFEELLVIQQQLNDQVGVANTLINVGEIDRNLGQIERMEMYNKKALEISQEAEYIKGIILAKINLADISVRRGNPTNAVSLYDEVVELLHSSGIKELLDSVLLLSGDAQYMIRNFEDAIVRYNQARTVSTETNDYLKIVLADVSKLVAYWVMNDIPPIGLEDKIRDLVGDPSAWMENRASSHMREIRRQLLDDDTIQSDLCIFFNPELNFKCRVDRSSTDKECFGNILWSGTVCRFLINFIKRLWSSP